jgi:hypothetical protein
MLLQKALTLKLDNLHDIGFLRLANYGRFLNLVSEQHEPFLDIHHGIQALSRKK